MNYSEIKKQKEQKLNDAQASLIAKKKIIEDALAKKTKLEKECQEKLGIPLSKVANKIEVLKIELDQLTEEISKGVDEIEQKLSSIN